MNVVMSWSQKLTAWVATNWTFDYSVLAVMAFFAIVSGAYFWSIRK